MTDAEKLRLLATEFGGNNLGIKIGHRDEEIVTGADLRRIADRLEALESEPPIVVRTPRRVGPLIELEQAGENSDDEE